jgi:hypothetical protein
MDDAAGTPFEFKFVKQRIADGRWEWESFDANRCATVRNASTINCGVFGGSANDVKQLQATTDQHRQHSACFKGTLVQFYANQSNTAMANTPKREFNTYVLPALTVSAADPLRVTLP